VLAAATHAEQVILGSYMTASAIARYIRASRGADAHVTIIAMGFEGARPSIEDDRCGDYIEHLLTGKPYDHLEAMWECLHDPDIATSLRGEHDYRPQEDIVLALQRDLFTFAMVGTLQRDHVRVTRADT
jgi:2-phosphosulfolactate phosphatase